MLPRLLILLLIIFSQIVSLAQAKNVDSLQLLLREHNQNDTTRVILLNELSNEYYRADIEKTLYFAIIADSLSTKLDYKRGKAESLRMIGRYYWRISDYTKALELFENSLILFDSIKDKMGVANCYNNIGSTYWRWGDYQKTLDYFMRSLKLREEIGDKEGVSASYNNLGIIYRTQGDYSNALDYYHKSVTLKEEIGDKAGISDSYNNIAIIYSSQGEYAKALDYHEKSLRIREETGARRGMAVNYNNISISYVNMGNYEKALEYVKKSVEIRKELDDKAGMASALNNMAEIYMKMSDYSKALKYFNESIDISIEIGLKSIEAYGYIGLAETYLSLNKKQKSYDNSIKAYSIAKSIGDVSLLRSASEIVAKSSALLGKYKDAYNLFGEFKILSDSLRNEEMTRKILGLEFDYKYEKEKELSKIEQEKRDAIFNEEMKRQKSIRNSLLLGILLVLTMLAIVYFNFVQKRRINQELEFQKKQVEVKNDELIKLNEEITYQKDQIEESHLKITESLTYATFIQTAVLPTEHNIQNLFPNHFLLFKPCEIVSGDFYFVRQIDGFNIIAAADCTGHGVPGALMSMLGLALLNDIVRNIQQPTSAKILTQLRNEVKLSLQQRGQKDQQRDGMDIALCCINAETLEMTFSGAYNPCWIFRSNEHFPEKYQHIVLEADRTPVGVSEREKPFTDHSFQLQKGDSFYIFTDGYHSQFGGERNEKFQIKRLQSLISKIHGNEMPLQKKILEQTLADWQGNKTQIDDILVIGVRL